jgi:hypothetical protein
MSLTQPVKYLNFFYKQVPQDSFFQGGATFLSEGEPWLAILIPAGWVSHAAFNGLANVVCIYRPVIRGLQKGRHITACIVIGKRFGFCLAWFAFAYAFTSHLIAPYFERPSNRGLNFDVFSKRIRPQCLHPALDHQPAIECQLFSMVISTLGALSDCLFSI